MNAGPSGVINMSTVAYKLYHLAAVFVDRGRRNTQNHASVNLVYDRKPRRYAEDNRTEFNCTH